MMIIQTIPKKKKISEFLAVVGIILLILDTINTFTSQHGYGFLYLTNQSGIAIGIPSIIMLFVSYGFGFRQRSKITTSLIIFGGALLAISKMIEPEFHLNLYLALALPYLFISLIAMGFILLGLGLSRIFIK